MVWLMTAALVCWLGYVACRVRMFLQEPKITADTLVYLRMGNQGEVTEWFFWKLYQLDTMNNGRMALAVEVEEALSDTLGIVKIISREKGFIVVDPGQWSVLEKDWPVIRYFNLTGLDAREQLRSSLETLKAC